MPSESPQRATAPHSTSPSLSSRPLRRGTCLATVLLALVIILACAPDAWARAGGGGGFSGGGGGGFSGGGSFGGGSSFGGGGGGGGGGAASPLAILIVVILSIAWNVVEQWRQDRQPYVRPSYKWSPPDNLAEHLQALQEVDPQFDWTRMKVRIERAFLNIQNAWQTQDLDPVLPFISDSIFERFSLQIQEQIREGYRDHMPSIEVHRDQMSIVGLTVTDHFESLDVSITCTAIDYRVSIETGRPIDGDRHASETFVEIWSFLRRRGVTSESTDGLLEGQCPNCGDALELNRAGACSSCAALVRSGEFDWVLAEITQASVFDSTRQGQSHQTISQYREKRDTGFTVQHLEDRASVIFWRKVLADRNGHVDPLRKMATDEFCADYGETLDKSTQQGGREFWHDCSVGSVDCLGVVRDEDDDHAIVLVRWAGNEFRVHPDGRLEDLHRWNRLNSLLILKRRAGVQSNLDRAITSAHCPSCGAPETDITSHTCEFCGEVVNDGRFDWVLNQWLVANSDLALAWKDQLKAPRKTASAPSALPSAADALDWAVMCIVADREISDQESRAVMRLARRQGISSEQAQQLVNQAARGKLVLATPPSRDAARAWMTMVADVAIADGVIDDAETAVLVQLGNEVNMSRYDVDLLLAKCRTRHRRASEA